MNIGQLIKFGYSLIFNDSVVALKITKSYNCSLLIWWIKVLPLIRNKFVYVLTLLQWMIMFMAQKVVAF